MFFVYLGGIISILANVDKVSRIRSNECMDKKSPGIPDHWSRQGGLFVNDKTLCQEYYKDGTELV